MTTLVLLPGMDGTGLLFAPLIEALSGRFPIEVVKYPLAAPAGYADLEQFAARPRVRTPFPRTPFPRHPSPNKGQQAAVIKLQLQR